MPAEPGDPRPEGRDAVAIITALLPVYTESDTLAAEYEWEKAMPTLVSIMRDKPREDLVTLVGHLGHIAAHLVMLVNPEDPYEIVQQLGKDHQ